MGWNLLMTWRSYKLSAFVINFKLGYASDGPLFSDLGLWRRGSFQGRVGPH